MNSVENQAGYKFIFNPSVPVSDVEETLLLSVIAAESLHGKSRLRRDVVYEFRCERESCVEQAVLVIESNTDAGRDLAKLFTGFAIREYGEDAFRVRRS